MSTTSKREAQVARILANTPQSAQNSLARAFSGAASPRAAIKAQCLQCVGFDRNEIKNCTGWSCPLWSYRPFQEADDVGQHHHEHDHAHEARHDEP
jgi:hypothetical protein